MTMRGTGQACPQDHGAATAGIACAASLMPVVLGKAARHIGGDAAIERAISTFKQIDKPVLRRGFCLLPCHSGRMVYGQLASHWVSSEAATQLQQRNSQGFTLVPFRILPIVKSKPTTLPMV